MTAQWYTGRSRNGTANIIPEYYLFVSLAWPLVTLQSLEADGGARAVFLIYIYGFRALARLTVPCCVFIGRGQIVGTDGTDYVHVTVMTTLI